MQKQKTAKKIISLALALILTFALVPMTTKINAMGDTFITTISAGGSHSLAIKSDGSLWAWGLNSHGQLGDGTGGYDGAYKSMPVKIMDDVITVSAESYSYYSLAIKSDGSLWAWGSNSQGQLGDGTTTDRHTPIKIMDDVTAVSAGVSHSLAIKNDGSLWAWGLNKYGQLGDGTTTDRYTPVKIMDGVTAVSAGTYHSLAIKSDGSLWAWGYNRYGQLGDDTMTNRYTPVKIMDGVTAVSAGGGIGTGNDHSLAIKSDGSLWAWGWNWYGALGDETIEYSLNPIKIMDGVIAVSAGHYYNLAIKSDGSLWAWGCNWYGALGDGTTTDRHTPIKIMDGVIAISAGLDHSLAIKSDGSLWGWGDNSAGQIGDGTTENRLTSVKIMDGVKIPTKTVTAIPTPPANTLTTISAGNYHSLAIKSDGSLWAWGDNNYGQLGDGTTTDRLKPVKIMDGVTAVSAGRFRSFAIKNDGSLWAWGHGGKDGYTGYLGDGTTEDRHTPVKIMDGVTAISASADHAKGSAYHCLAIKSDGSLWAWGLNRYGQLGDGTTTDRLKPVKIMDGVTAVSAVSSTSYAIKNDGSLWGWGGHYGQFGDIINDEGRIESKPTPVKIMDGVKDVSRDLFIKSDGSLWSWGYIEDYNYKLVKVMDNVTAVSMYAGYELIIKNDSSLWAWGDTYWGGYTGDGTQEQYIELEVPVKIMDDVIGASAGLNHSLAVKSDGSLWAWGENGAGQIGDGTTTDRYAPVKIMDGVKIPTKTVTAIPTPPANTFTTISAGSARSFTIKSDGSLWAWGRGLLGDGTTTDSHTPVKIMDDVTAVSAGIHGEEDHNLAIKSDGSLWAWGVNLFGQLGDDTLTYSHTPVKIMDGVIAVSTGGLCSLAIKSDGSLWAWGNNWNGQLGDGTTTDRHTPVKIMDDVIEVSAEFWHSLAVKSDGSLWAWGINYDGQLGDGTTENRLTPVKIMDGVTAVSAGNNYSMVIKSDGSLWACGDNYNGQLGDGTITVVDNKGYLIENNNKATYVKIMDDVTAVSAGPYNSLAIKSDGSLWAWGDNSGGQLGDGTTENKLTPVKIMDGVTAVSAGSSHSLAVKSDGSLWAWGYNGSGQIGDGTITVRDWQTEGQIGQIIENNNKATPVKIMDGVMLPETSSTLTTSIPGEPTAKLTALVTEVGVKFDFTSATSKFGYRIYRSTDPSAEGISITDFPITGTKFVDVNVDPNVTYYYTIRKVISEADFDRVKVEIIPEVLGEPSEQIVLNSGDIIDPPIIDDGQKHTKNFLLMKVGEPNMLFNEELREIDPGRGTVPQIVNARTLIPIRAIIDCMGGNVGWNDDLRQVSLTYGELSAMDFDVTMTIGDCDFVANGENKTMDVAPQIINSRTMLPIRFVSENVGAEIAWIGSTSEIIVVFYTRVL